MTNILRYKGKETCDALISHMEKGYSFSSFSAIAGVKRNCLYDWVTNYPEFAEAKSIAEAKALLMFEKIAIAKIRGKKQVDNAGNIIFDPRLSDTAMAIFFLKTRFNHTYNERQDMEDDSEVEFV